MKSCQENTDGRVCFHREPANVGKIRHNLFLNSFVPLWNDRPIKVKEEESRMVSRLGWMDWGCSPLAIEGSGYVSFRLRYY